MFENVTLLFIFRALGRLHPSAKMYGDVFVNGAKLQMPYGSYVCSLLVGIIFYFSFSNFPVKHICLLLLRFICPTFVFFIKISS